MRPSRSLLQIVPYDVSINYSIPRILTDDIQKSKPAGDEPLTRGEVQLRLERAIQRGACDPRVLGLFASNPDKALRCIPDEVRKSYGLPETWGDTLRKSQSPTGAGVSNAETYGQMMDAIFERALSPHFRTRW